MGVLADWQVKRDVRIEPFAENEARPGKVSYGLTSYGYDARLGYKFKVFTPVGCVEVDPKAFSEDAFVDKDLTPLVHSWTRAWPKMMRDPPATHYSCTACMKKAPIAEYPDGLPPEFYQESCPRRTPPNYLTIPPNSFVLGETLETFTIPRDCIAVCVGKSTYARCGIVVNVTPLEPEWTGKVTVEISNTSPLPARVYAGEGIMQVIFFRTDGRNEALMDVVGVMSHRTHQYGETINGLSTGDQRGTVKALFQSRTASCRTSYADKKGRYQGQAGVTLPFVQEERKDDHERRPETMRPD